MIDREEVRTDSQQAVVRLALLIFDVNLIKLSKHWERRSFSDRAADVMVCRTYMKEGSRRAISTRSIACIATGEGAGLKAARSKRSGEGLALLSSSAVRRAMV